METYAGPPHIILARALLGSRRDNTRHPQQTREALVTTMALDVGDPMVSKGRQAGCSFSGCFPSVLHFWARLTEEHKEVGLLSPVRSISSRGQVPFRSPAPMPNTDSTTDPHHGCQVLCAGKHAVKQRCSSFHKNALNTRRCR